ncbi:hypothetical protein PMN64_00490 [Bradyrhizobium sp. UFLA01-814]|uniref:hypothetical protein n=1 Tax=Bradyrhizobium sp. UFLA01-814 TaxID=3023480 RepID=UPI00398AF6DA
MRAYVIDPMDESLSEVDLPDLTSEIRRLFDGARIERVETLPAGDAIHLVVSDASAGTFRVGGSRDYRGVGLVLGRRGAFGLFGHVMTDLDSLSAILRFGSCIEPQTVAEVTDDSRHRRSDCD